MDSTARRAKALELAVEAHAHSIEDYTPDAILLMADEFAAFIENGRLPEVDNGRTNQTVTDEFLRDVAEVWRSNEKAPTKTVALHYKTTQRNAHRWVAEARERGLL